MFTSENQEEMINFFELLILAYFKQYHINYSLGDMSKKLGLSEMQVSNYISGLVEKKHLVYENDLLTLTIAGINRLANSSMANYAFDADINSLFEGERWPITKVYCPYEFSKERWRGSK